MQKTWDMGLIAGSGRAPGGGHGNPLQFSCLENPMDRGARQATVHRVTKSWTPLKWFSTKAKIYVLKPWQVWNVLALVPFVSVICYCIMNYSKTKNFKISVHWSLPSFWGQESRSGWAGWFWLRGLSMRWHSSHQPGLQLPEGPNGAG